MSLENEEEFEQDADRILSDILDSVMRELYYRNENDCVSSALFFLLTRVANTWKSIRTLINHTPEQFHDTVMVDAAVLLRCMFDAYLQAHYIVDDASKRIERATLYLEFAHIELFKNSRKTLKHDNPLTRRLKPRVGDGEKRLEEEFDRVKNQYLERSRTREKWYKGNLFDLAKKVGRTHEYDTCVTPYSGCVHSSANALKNGPKLTPPIVLIWSQTLVARVLQLNTRSNKLNLGGPEGRLVEALSIGLLDDALEEVP